MRNEELWTRGEIVKALGLYCVLPFGRFHKANRDVIALARNLGRTPGSIALKLTNLASLDPSHRSRGVSGMSHASTLDKEVWTEYYGRWEELAASLPAETQEPEDEAPLDLPPGPTTRKQWINARRGQRFFSKAVLSAYERCCCITGIANPQLLRASHILAWAECEAERLNPRNGLCLNALHDAAFDKHLLTLDAELRVVVSPRLARLMPREVFARFFRRYSGQPIRMPTRFAPDPAFLNEHRRRFAAIRDS